MQTKFLLFTLLFTSILLVNSFAQEMPLVYDVENTGADVPKPVLPPSAVLPSVTNLPDPFMWSDGRARVAHFSDWRVRRAEIGAEIQNYEIGEKPPRPDTITASYSSGVLTVVVTVNGKTLTLSSQVLLPAGSGPFPAIIGMNSPSGSIPGDMLSARGIARITFSHNQVTSYGGQSNSDPYYKLYPYLNSTNTGQYSAWSWGISRLIDGLELVQDSLPIDLKHIGVTGCSYAGKMALFAGAFDERIALTMSVESGGGGYTTWRVSETLGNVETLARTDYNWFRESMKEFSTSVSKLPEDHHELMAMVAPRALLVTGNPDYVWLADESGHVGSNAAKEVWKALGIPDRFGYSIVAGHGHCNIPPSQIPEFFAFIDKFLLGKDTVNTNIATTPYSSNLAPWITWTTPVLTPGESFFGLTTLVSPVNEEVDLETTVTFKWSKLPNASKYFFQASTDPSFTTLLAADSTIDTTITISNLLKGKKYFWRVQVVNTQGSRGPFSEAWNFTTFITLPLKPVLVSATPATATRADVTVLKWSKGENADQYLIQLATKADFSTVMIATSATDTFKNVNGTAEGMRFYWRVQSKNIKGNSEWSDPGEFYHVLPPSNLTLTKTGETTITLTWKDNSAVEQGFIVERKMDQNASFTFLDTVKGAVEYIDRNITASQNYIYRVSAYKESAVSPYSNEAALIPTAVEDTGNLPSQFSLSQNYPNPFNPSTKIKFALPHSASVKITVYNLLGREIRTLLNSQLEAGYHSINFDSGNLPSGVYLYKIQAADFVQTKKMILMR